MFYLVFLSIENIVQVVDHTAERIELGNIIDWSNFRFGPKIFKDRFIAVGLLEEREGCSCNLVIFLLFIFFEPDVIFRFPADISRVYILYAAT